MWKQEHASLNSSDSLIRGFPKFQFSRLTGILAVVKYTKMWSMFLVRNRVCSNVKFIHFRVQSFIAKIHTSLNSVMNGLIKQLFTPNSTVAQLVVHKTEDLRRTSWCRFESRKFCKNFVLIFTKWKKCYYLLVLLVAMPLCSNIILNHTTECRQFSTRIFREKSSIPS